MSSGAGKRVKLAAVAGPSSSGESSPKIFKLDIDCFDEIFEYLSMKDLHSLGQTCKTMQQVAGVYFKEHYWAAEKFCSRDGIYTVHSSRDGAVNERILTSAFNAFMPCISHYHERLEPLEYLKSHIDEFCQSTNHIYLVEMQINSTKVAFIKELLPHIEIVQIRSCRMNGSFYELMLKHCPKLHTIYVQNADTISNGEHAWLRQDYPLLRHLELMPGYTNEVDELYAFLERHPNVQRFSTNGRFLWFNRSRFLKSNIKLDILEVKAEYFYGESKSNTIWDFMRQLHKQGFYKRLFIYTDRISPELSIQLTTVPGLELLCIRWFDKSYNLPFLVELKELIILDGLNANDADILANGLVKLERLYVDNTTIECIQPFIRQSTKLNKIKLLLRDRNAHGYNGDDMNVYWVDDVDDVDDDDDYSGDSGGSIHDEEDYDPSENGDEFPAYVENMIGVIDLDANEDNDGNGDEIDPDAENRNEEKNDDEAKDTDTSDWRVLNLVAMNAERAKLTGARKITIYVRDDVFLATKWTTTHGNTNLNLIEMKRSDSLEWNHHY